MVISSGGTAEDRSVWVEGGGCDGRSAVLLEEAGVWLEAGEFVAF